MGSELSRRILIVDDQEDLRQQVVRLLSQGSSSNETSSLIEQIRNRISKSRETPTSAHHRITYQVDTVGQGKEAFSRVKASFSENQPYALMFLDMRMPPGWDGLETAQRIRGIDKEIQIVIMTAYADYEQQEIAEKIGEPDKLIYLKKPFHPEEIRQLALAMTEKWNMNRREKERVILTNRLMRENARLTKRTFSDLTETYRSVLDAFAFFLDARTGILVRRRDDKEQVCCSTSPEDETELLGKLSEKQKQATRIVTDTSSGDALFPIIFDNFTGYVYIQGKNLIFSFEQLMPYLEILLETTHEVLKNAFLLQQHNEKVQLTAVASVMKRLTGDISRVLDENKKRLHTLRVCGEEQKCPQLYEDVENSSGEILALCQDMLQFAEPEQAEPPSTPVDLQKLIASLYDSFASRIQQAGIEWSLLATENLQTSGNEAALRRCFWHLLDNAIDALENADVNKKTKKLSVRIEPTGSRVTVRICDTGDGIPEEVAQNLFSSFATAGKEGANGLGATLARKIAQRHGGDISFRSTPGEGTCFAVTVPLYTEKKFGAHVPENQ